ncbi:MAG: exo-alpha-sialidase, partial [Acidobacteria bacterium]|nr:exo-alpha-sialidase [Acidobacteriota bacterium]
MPKNPLSLAVMAFLVVLSTGCGSDQAATASLGNQGSTFPPASAPLVRLSTDIFANPGSQHATEVEPDSFSFGPRLVSAFQAGRIYSGGASDIGFAVSADAGVTWQSGFLPGLTIFQGGGTNASVSDPAVAYDARQDVWIISSLTIALNGATQVVVSRSSDGGMSWGSPVAVSHTPDPDKDWISCDNSRTSPFYGHCYVEWDDASQGDRIWMSMSSDGGQTWQPEVNPAGAPGGIGGQPLVQPGGTVIVPFLGNLPQIQAFSSHDGGLTWTAPVIVAPVVAHLVAGGLRTDPLPSAQMDGAGTIYVVWQDCSFRASCVGNDLVMSTSTDGASWTQPARIPISAI